MDATIKRLSSRGDWMVVNSYITIVPKVTMMKIRRKKGQSEEEDTWSRELCGQRFSKVLDHDRLPKSPAYLS